jgi:tetratricopeptide (TPR) repeat protein
MRAKMRPIEQSIKTIVTALLLAIVGAGCTRDGDVELRRLKAEYAANPHECIAASDLAYAYQNRREYEKAISQFSIARKNCGDQPTLLFQVGATYVAMGQKDKGLEYLDAAVELAKKQKDRKLLEMLETERTRWRRYEVPK